MSRKAVARFEYSPALDRKGNRVRRDGLTTEWWLILRCDPELGRYLRALHHVDHHRTQSLQEPLWGAHVSLVRGELPPNQDQWGTLRGKSLLIEYTIEPQETDGYVWLPVQCEEALDYRESLGLPRKPLWPLHLTIGNNKVRA